MKDIYSPSQSPNDGSDTNFDPIPMPGGIGEVPELNFDVPPAPVEKKQEDFDPGFYGSYGEAAKQADPDAAAVPDFSVPEIEIPEPSGDSVGLPPAPDFGSDSYGGASSFDAPFSMPEEDLTIPDMPAPAADHTRVSKKSMGYETTVKLKNARHAERDEKRINEPIKKNARPVYAPKEREFNGIASGTAHVSGGLPELKDNQMYVAVTPKELRRLKSRKFRGLGVFSALCLAVIAAFCIWSYVNSFADPIVGRWRGDINSLAMGIESLQELGQDSMSSTWEFNSSGSMYVNLVLNDTPVSLSGSYLKLTDGNGEQYLSMTLKNPMDNQDYEIKMYYTITGEILQFNDMEGAGAEIDLVKE